MIRLKGSLFICILSSWAFLAVQCGPTHPLRVVRCSKAFDGSCLGIDGVRSKEMLQTMAQHPYNMAYSLQKKDDSSGLTRSEIFEMLERLKRYIPLDESRSIRASNGLYPDYGPMRTPVKDSDGLLDQFVQTFQAMGNQVGGPRVRSTFDDESRGDLVTLNHLIRGI